MREQPDPPLRLMHRGDTGFAKPLHNVQWSALDILHDACRHWTSPEGKSEWKWGADVAFIRDMFSI